MRDALARRHFALIALLAAVAACDEKTDADDPTPVVEADAGSAQVKEDAGPLAVDADVGETPADAQTLDAAPPVPDAVVEPEGCTDNAFTADIEYGNMEPVARRYTAMTGNEYPFKVMVVELRTSEGGPTEEGTYDVRVEDSLQDCTVCVYALDGCNPETGQCEKIFVPDAGTIEITRIGRAGRNLVATLHNVAFVEIELDRSDLSLTRVDGGAGFCVDEHPIDVELKPPPANLGEVVNNFSLQNCETGEFVDLDTLAGHTNGLWIVAVAGWCSACHQFLPQALRFANQFQGGVLRMIAVVGEDAAYGQPTLEFCRRYSTRYAPSAGQFYIDHNGQRSFATTFENINPYLGPQGEFALPWNAIIQGRTFLYRYADRSGAGVELPAALDAIVAGD